MSDEEFPPPSAKLVKPPPRRKNPSVIVDDLSDGRELFPIRVFNDITKATVPPFQYITTTETFKNYKRNPLVCECKDGCDESCVCMSCPYSDQYVDIPYDDKGNLKSFPKKWMKSHRVLWECSEKCGCGPECPSRHQMEVFMTEKKGWGVRALRAIPKGAFVAEYAGVMQEAKDDETWSDNNWYSFDIVSEDGMTNFFVDATQKGNVARFFNHGCEPNMMAFHVFYDDNNPIMGMHICFYAVRDIEEMEELTFDYGEAYWNAKKKKGNGCECAAPTCNYRVARKKLTKKFKKAKTVHMTVIDEIKVLTTLAQAGM